MNLINFQFFLFNQSRNIHVYNINAHRKKNYQEKLYYINYINSIILLLQNKLKHFSYLYYS